MSRAEERGSGARPAQREPLIRSAALAVLASIVALWPYTPVVEAGRWTLLSVTMILIVAATGIAVRALLRHRRPGIRSLITLVAQIGIAAGALTLVLLPSTALFGVLPTSATGAAFLRLIGEAAAEVYNGSAPLTDTPGLRAVLAVSFALIATLLDHLVSSRLPLMTVVLVTAVGAVPMIATLGEPNVGWFIVLAILALVLLRRGAHSDVERPRAASLGTTAGVGVAAIALTLVVAPALPVSAAPGVRPASITVDASLRLGDDLRRPDPIQVLSIATSAETAPYLRLATLSRFSGEVWRPDLSPTQPLTEGFGDREWSTEQEGPQRLTSIRVLAMSSTRLPVPYPAQRIVGLPAGWQVMPENRTVLNSAGDASGQDYTVTSARVQPTLEQITAAAATGAPVYDVDLEGIPASIGETAQQVTENATTDYERLITLQNWFRNSFEYSVDAPVDEGFDGTGAEAVATFLEARSGYCIHFAGAFALMARSMDMPVRVVIGYLPGTLTDEQRGDEFVFAVASDQLHAWPEVHFEGIGWVPFEPTATLGVPTAFAPAAPQGGPGSGGEAPTAPGATPSATPTAGPNLAPEETTGSAGGASDLRRVDATPVMLTLLGVVVVALLPMLIRIARRAVRYQRAHAGDATAAWEELRDSMIDLGMTVSDADSARARAAELVTAHAADAQDLSALVDAIERASYAASAGPAGNVAAPLRRVLRQVRQGVDRRGRLAALFAPRSLFAQRPSADLVTS